jgi:hypothetical protein
MSSKFFGNKNEKKPLVTKGTKQQNTIKSVPKQTQIRKTGRGK